ncbi:hypothetical protein [Rickettsia typhi]|nr:hypothetical protein [Rickettsia typhi]AFE54503.1 hypothetical protein RTTH1527_03190 [Rickettsia typhi str. TH1527]AFE54545.1 hypothetical protein RTTH1527_03400 [Rickettsia typhi str. TH1527]AFE55342.1 hypothetical protein RTB9991CWPP_03195 [Rickettsia typhi str. B9991CWPP]AFE55384.1 hypothetical protein RTB9991CWPP_03405 [Rickettsia typhi str. B9991CWPP]
MLPLSFCPLSYDKEQIINKALKMISGSKNIIIQITEIAIQNAYYMLIILYKYKALLNNEEQLNALLITEKVFQLFLMI